MTGGQYSLVRFLFGTYLVVHFAMLLPWGAEVFSSAGLLQDGSLSPLLHVFPNVLALWDGPAFVTAMLGAAILLSLLLALGWHDRVAAVLLWYVWACLHGRMPLISNPGLPYVGWLLLAHACLPAAPFGSLAARGRADPGAGWTMPRDIVRVAWILMALGYSYSGATKLVSPSWLDGTAIARVLENPLARPGLPRDLLLSLPDGLLHAMSFCALAMELLFAPLALVRRLRPWLWLALLSMHLGLMAVIDFADLSLGMVMLHLFTFDPAWVGPRARGGTLFYDGGCGLCHRTVRFLLAEDRAGAFRFAPLDSEAFRAAVPAEIRAALPDSLVLRTTEGEIITRSAAVRRVLASLGGLWGALGSLAGLVPMRALDALYDAVARVRRRIFAAPAGACPILPAHLRERFVYDLGP